MINVFGELSLYISIDLLENIYLANNISNLCSQVIQKLLELIIYSDFDKFDN